MRQTHPKTNGYSNVVRLASLEKRRAEADERNAARAARSTNDQIALLNRRPGLASKERERLFAPVAAHIAKKAAENRARAEAMSV